MECGARAEEPVSNADTASQLFTTFRTTRDPAALARVFELTGPRLLGAARRFAAGEPDVQDLVQSTFVTAIEQAHRFRTDQPLLPWLFGILTNHGRRRWRNRLETAAGDVDVAAVGGGPAELALRAETRAWVAAAIARLPMPYREVVERHLVEGLAPHDLARALRRPAATVRTQMARGLVMLRRNLPRDLGAGVLVLFPAPLGWTAAAAEVLAGMQRTGESGVPALLAPGRSVRASGRRWLRPRSWRRGVVAVAALAVPLLVGLFAWNITAGDLSPRIPGAEDSRTEGSAMALAVGPGVEQSDRDVVEGTERKVGSVVLTVVGTDRLTPLADLPVRLCMGDVAGGSLLGGASAEIAAGRTDASGIVRFGPVPAGPAVACFDDGRQRCGPLQIRSGAELRLVHQLETQALVRGVVRDAGGQPLAGAEVWLTSQPGTIGPGYLAAHAGRDGGFEVRALSDTWGAWARQQGIGSSRLFRPRTRTDRFVVELVVEETRAGLTGEVVDEDGSPVAGAVVSACPIAPDIYTLDPARHAVSDANGRYAFEGLPAGPCLVAATAHRRAPAICELGLDADRVATATLRMVAGATLRGRLTPSTASRSGDLRVEVVPRATGSLLAEVDRFAVSGPVDAGGAFRIEGVPTGHDLARLVAADAPGCSLASCAFEALPDATITWNPEVKADLAIRGRIVDEQDVPQPGLRVSAVPPCFQWKDARSVERVAWTDAAGEFAVQHLPDADFDLYVEDAGGNREPRQFAVQVAASLAPGPLTHTFRLPAGLRASAFLVGSVHDQHGKPLPDVTVYAWRWRQARDGGTLTDERGAFRAGAYPPGPYRVTLMRSWRDRVYLGDFTLAAGQVLDLGRIEMRDPGWIALEFPTAGPRALHDKLEVQTPDGWTLGGFNATAGSDADATSMRSWALPPGRHHVRLQGSNYFWEARDVEVRSGAVTTLAVTPKWVVPCRIVADFADGDGMSIPFPPTVISILDAEGRVFDRRMLPSGEATHRCGLAAGWYSISVRSAFGRTVTVPFQVVAGAAEAELVVPVR